MKTTHRNPARRVTRYLFVFLALLLGGGVSAVAQQAAAPQYRVGTISIKFVGTANVSDAIVRDNMQVKEGGPLDDSMIDRDIRALYRTGLFDFIEVKRQDAGGGVFNLVFVLTPKFRVLAVRYEGNHKISSRRLGKEVKTKPNTALDERQVKEDSEKIREYYQKIGYNKAVVHYVIERDRSTGFGTVIFKIDEGARTRISLVRFTGNTHISSRTLRRQIDTRRWWIFSWLTDHGRFIDDTFQDDLGKLREYYRNQGFLDVSIPEDAVTFDYPTPKKMVINIPVSEGRQYHIGTISFEGNKLYPSALLSRVVLQRDGAVFRPDKIDKDIQRLQDFYGTSGYLDTDVRLERKPNLQTGNIDIVYKIQEGTKAYVESINLTGNTKTKSVVIIRELVLGPGDVFDTVRMKISKLRLENTRFFDDVDMSPEDTDIPGRRNLRIAVHEGRTGNLTFGAGYSSLEHATVFAELQQSNFDLFNPRSLFQGAGQKFRIRLQLGSLSSQALLSFDEPWLFQRRLGAGFTLFRTSSDYFSNFYSEVDTGGEVHLRKRLFELVDGQLTYTYEKVGISDVDPSVAQYVQAGTSTISSLGLQLVRDTRDKLINTTLGNRVELDATVAGGPFSGDVDYYKLEFRGSQFYPVFALQNQVLAVIARGGVIQNYGRSADVPYYAKYYLGGPDTLRGFQYNDVSPRDAAGQLIGAKSYGMISFEYSLDIVSPVRVAVFYDGGFANVDAYDFNPSGWHDDVGVGLRLFVAGAPLSLDYAIPMTADRFSKKGNQFNFSFGTRF